MRGSAWPLAAAMLSAIGGGTNAVATRLAVADADPGTIAALRYVAAAILLLVIAHLLGARPWRIARRDAAPLLLLGLGQFALFGLLFTQGFAYIPAARGALILATMPLLTLLLAAAMGRERLTGLKLTGVALGAAGVAVALGERAGTVHPEAWRGDLMLFAGTLVCSVYNVFAPPYLRRYGALSVTAFGMACAGAALAALFVATGSLAELAAIDARGWWAVAYLAVIGSAGTSLLWLWALERIAPTRVAITLTLNPLAAAVFGAALLGEAPGPRLIGGLALVGLAILLVNRPGRG